MHTMIEDICNTENLQKLVYKYRKNYTSVRMRQKNRKTKKMFYMEFWKEEYK